MKDSSHPVVFFDGVCNLCNRTVQFIIRHDRMGIFRFASLQSKMGEQVKAEVVRERTTSPSGYSSLKKGGEFNEGSGYSSLKEGVAFNEGSGCSSLKEGGALKVDSIILAYKGKYYTKSSAALKIGMLLGGVGWLLVPGYIFPSFIRDAIYDAIAKRRYQWFGRRDECMIPTPELKARFLDE